MTPWKNWLTGHLRFTRRERIGLLALFFILFSAFVFPIWLSRNASPSAAFKDSSWSAMMQKLEDTSASMKEKEGNNGLDYAAHEKPYSPANGRLFPFDPNTLSPTGWQELGLRPKTIQTIRNYLDKGGKFRKAEDLGRIYGLKKEEFERLLPYIQIQEMTTGEKSSRPFPNSPYPTDQQQRQHKRAIDINLADTSALISLPGIGSKLAARIISFREKLGGFHSVAQIGETYGLPDSTFQRIKSMLVPGTTPVRKININTATMDELKAHPYIRYNLAKPILAYRNEHGLFTGLEDLKKIAAIPEDVYQKISPYLTL